MHKAYLKCHGRCRGLYRAQTASFVALFNKDTL